MNCEYNASSGSFLLTGSHCPATPGKCKDHYVRKFGNLYVGADPNSSKASTTDAYKISRVTGTYDEPEFYVQQVIATNSPTYTKGSTNLGTVSSNNRNTYPDNNHSRTDYGMFMMV